MHSVGLRVSHAQMKRKQSTKYCPFPHDLIPYLIVDDGKAALAFYEKALIAEVTTEMPCAATGSNGATPRLSTRRRQPTPS